MTTTDTTPRLRHRAPTFDRKVGDSMALGFERAIEVATQRARAEGVRYVVTGARFVRRAYDEPILRVQAWR